MPKINFDLTFDSVTFNAKSQTVELSCDVYDLVSAVGSDDLLEEIGEEECIKYFAIQVADEYK